MGGKKTCVKSREWEKERRDKLNVGFNDLSKLLPEHDPSISLSKMDILRKAAEFIRQLQDQNDEIVKSGNNDVLKNETDRLRKRVAYLVLKTKDLVNALKAAGVPIPNNNKKKGKSKETGKPVNGKDQNLVPSLTSPVVSTIPIITHGDPANEKKLITGVSSQTHATFLNSSVRLANVENTALTSSLGAGTLILRDGRVITVPPPTPIIPQILVKPQPAVIVMQRATPVAIKREKFPLIFPKRRDITQTTYMNKTPIPAIKTFRLESIKRSAKTSKAKNKKDSKQESVNNVSPTKLSDGKGDQSGVTSRVTSLEVTCNIPKELPPSTGISPENCPLFSSPLSSNIVDQENSESSAAVETIQNDTECPESQINPGICLSEGSQDVSKPLDNQVARISNQLFSKGDINDDPDTSRTKVDNDLKQPEPEGEPSIELQSKDVEVSNELPVEESPKQGVPSEPEKLTSIPDTSSFQKDSPEKVDTPEKPLLHAVECCESINSQYDINISESVNPDQMFSFDDSVHGQLDSFTAEPIKTQHPLCSISNSYNMLNNRQSELETNLPHLSAANTQMFQFSSYSSASSYRDPVFFANDFVSTPSKTGPNLGSLENFSQNDKGGSMLHPTSNYPDLLHSSGNLNNFPNLSCNFSVAPSTSCIATDFIPNGPVNKSSSQYTPAPTNILSTTKQCDYPLASILTGLNDPILSGGSIVLSKCLQEALIGFDITTAAFLLAFPLVSTSKNTENPHEQDPAENNTSTPTTILQIGNIEPPNSELFHPLEFGKDLETSDYLGQVQDKCKRKREFEPGKAQEAGLNQPQASSSKRVSGVEKRDVRFLSGANSNPPQYHHSNNMQPPHTYPVRPLPPSSAASSQPSNFPSNTTTSVTNFNLSTIFPEINERTGSQSQPNTAPQQQQNQQQHQQQNNISSTPITASIRSPITPTTVIDLTTFKFVESGRFI
ncbi:hypothetical protein GE061_015518 [Apolygus lucorum]|uniref:BHLH domain-containing protein n=1 Tax=Apolygus lucorum TaxID=248454 RepID=A0A8S9XNF3_APOLU|nr:hypothetical protein GE061_015518 [Apolygus lucorum]